MSRRAIVTAVVAIGIVCIASVAGSFVLGTANSIDDVFWKGDPVPPCFVNAALCGGHLLGTDEVGRDLVARLIAGSGPSLGMSLLAALVAGVVALVLGGFARYGGRVVSYLVARATEGILAIPRWPLVALAVVALSSHTTVPTYGLAFIVGAILWPRLTSLVLAGRPASILVPQVLRDWASAFLILATLDFLRWGVQPPAPSWGNMLADIEPLVQTGWWAALFPAVCIFVAVLAIEWAARANDASPRSGPYGLVDGVRDTSVS